MVEVVGVSVTVEVAAVSVMVEVVGGVSNG
jgi:hypothetical protein